MTPWFPLSITTNSEWTLRHQSEMFRSSRPFCALTTHPTGTGTYYVARNIPIDLVRTCQVTSSGSRVMHRKGRKKCLPPHNFGGTFLEVVNIKIISLKFSTLFLGWISVEGLLGSGGEGWVDWNKTDSEMMVLFFPSCFKCKWMSFDSWEM